MAAPIVEIASLQIDTDQVLKQSAALKSQLDSLRESNKSLQKSGQGSSVEFQKNAAEIKNLSKEYSDNQKLAASLIAVSKDTARTMETEGKSVQQLRNDRAKLQQLGKNITGNTKEEIEARNKLNKAINAQTEIIKSDASPAYIQQAENIGNYIGQQTQLGGVLEQGNNILNIGKGIYEGYGDSMKAAVSQITNAKAGTQGLTGAQKAGVVTTNLLSGAMKLLKIAIAATGIGLLVVALGSLIAYFTKTQTGADKLSKVMAAVGAVIDVLIDRVSSFGGALVKFLSGDFKGGFEDMKDSLSGLGDEMLREAAIAYQLEAAFQAVEDREISLIKTQAERKRNIAELRLLSKDQSKDINERVKLLDEAAKIERQSLNDELEIAKERARISQARLDLGESTRDDIRENAEAQAKVLELETQSLKLQETLESQRQSLLKQSQSEAATARSKRISEEVKAYNTELKLFNELNKEKLKTNVETLERAKDMELELIDLKVNRGLIKEREAVLERLKIENSFLEGKAAIEDKELERIAEFEGRKSDLENELRLAKAANDQEREQIRIEQEYEKHLAELETLELREGEKAELLLLLEEQKKLALAELDDQFNAEALEKRKAQADEEQKLEERRVANKRKSLDAIAGLVGTETGIGRAALIAKQLLAAKEQAIDLGLFTTKSTLKLGEATTDIAAGTAKSASAAPFPANVPLIAGFLGTVAGVVGSIKSATSKAKSSASAPLAERGMLLKGNRHSHGGILIEAEDGEAVINRKSTSKYLPLLNAINTDNGNGRPFMEMGGIAGDVSGPSATLIDYDLLASKVAEANASLPNPVVGVDEISSVAKRVQVAEEIAGF